MTREPGNSMVKIRIEHDDGTGYNLEVDDYSLELDNGVLMEAVPDQSASPTPRLRPVHNGQTRMLIKAWRGCQSYDSFQTEAPPHRSSHASHTEETPG